jgi:hypothetical protein
LLQYNTNRHGSYAKRETAGGMLVPTAYSRSGY